MKSIILGVFLVDTLLSSLYMAQSTEYQSPCSKLIWSDEFDGATLDAGKWTPPIGDGGPSLCGWGNAELQYYTDRTESMKVESGNLVITSALESYGGKNCTSARIRPSI